MQHDPVGHIRLSGDIQILYVDNESGYIHGVGLLKVSCKKPLYKT